MTPKGVYGLVEHKNNCYLTYMLEMPQEPGEVQQAFNIAKVCSGLCSACHSMMW